MHPSQLAIKDYTYYLPDEKIARYPLAERDLSKLLICREGQISESIYRDIAFHLPEKSMLVFNNTRVIEARLFFTKDTGAVIELFGLEPGDQYGGISQALSEQGKVYWKCLIGGASKWKHGQSLHQEIKTAYYQGQLQARIVERLEGSFLVEFSWDPPAVTFEEILHAAGHIPIPPYLKRETDPSDKERYQTIYAEKHGSVASPTAGLHFTRRVFDTLQERNISTTFVTLHVGAGTFMPVKADTMDGHYMHAEYLDISSSLLHRLLHHDEAIFAVGTTSLRTLESIYWMGVKCYDDPDVLHPELSITQWEVYDKAPGNPVSRKVALQSLITWIEKKNLENLVVKTRILIAPGYTFKMIDGLVTNFHQPQSTLLLLIAAITGDHWRNIYQYALENNFRFLSYGDGCLLYV